MPSSETLGKYLAGQCSEAERQLVNDWYQGLDTDKPVQWTGEDQENLWRRCYAWSIGGNPIGNIMIDHVSASWGLDENMSMYRHMYNDSTGAAEQKLPTVNITIQNSIFSETLDTYNHSFGSTLGGENCTLMRNLWADNAGRNPSIGWFGIFNFTNNVIFNWVYRSIDGGDYRAMYNIINNYFTPGPETPKDSPIGYRILKPEAGRSKLGYQVYGWAYVNGNMSEGRFRRIERHERRRLFQN